MSRGLLEPQGEDGPPPRVRTNLPPARRRDEPSPSGRRWRKAIEDAVC